jgi:hypothetical protein
LQFLSTQLSRAGESRFTLTMMRPDWLLVRTRILVFSLALVPLTILNVWCFWYFGLAISAIMGIVLTTDAKHVYSLYSLSLRNALKFRIVPSGAVMGATIGFLIGLLHRSEVDHVTIDHPQATLPWWIGAPVVGGVLGAAIFWLLGGIVASHVPRTPSPYEGIKRAFLNGVGAGAGVGFIGLAVYVVLIQLTSVGRYIEARHTTLGLGGTSRATQAVASGVLYFVIVGGWWAGLGAVLRHWLVRFGLWVADDAPLRYVTWLNDLVEARIVYRAGGGFVLIHRVLQEHLSAVAIERGAGRDRRFIADAGESQAN